MLAGQDRIVDNARTLASVKALASTDRTIIEYPEGHHTLEFEPDPTRYARDLIDWLDRKAANRTLVRSERCPWIPHVMVVDDDSRVLDSLIPSFADDLGRGLGQDPAVGGMLRLGEPAGVPAPVQVKLSAPRFRQRPAAGLPASLSPPGPLTPGSGAGRAV